MPTKPRGERKIPQVPRGIWINIHQSNLIEGFNSDEADILSFDAWKFITNHGIKNLEHRLIGEVQSRVTAHQPELDMWRGAYRDRSRVHVTVGGKEVLAPALVPAAMEEWLENFWDRTPKENHIRFEKIHPFIDGNGRVGRLLMWWQERRLGQPLTLIKYEDRAEYYRWFE